MFAPIPAVPDLQNVYGGGIAQAQNALTKNALEQTMKQLETKYYGPMSEAEIKSKNAYANFLPGQILGQVLSNPAVFASMPEAQRNNMLNMLNNSLGNAVNQTPGFNAPQNANPFSQNNIAPTNQMAQGLPINNKQIEALKTLYQQIPNQEPTLQQGEAAINSGQPISSVDTSGQIKIPGKQATPGGLSQSDNPLYDAYINKSYPTTQQEAAKARTVEEQQNIAKQWTERQDQMSQSALGNAEYLNNLQNFSNAYQRLAKAEKGPLLGRALAVSSAAQEADNWAGKMLTNAARSMQTGHITNADFTIASRLKPGRFLNDESAKHLIDYNAGIAKREQEHIGFNDGMMKLGLTPTEADQLWLKYIKAKPFYDKNDYKLLNQNINSWPQWLTQKKIDNVQNPKFGQEEREPFSKENAMASKMINGKMAYQDEFGDWYQ